MVLPAYFLSPPHCRTQARLLVLSLSQTPDGGMSLSPPFSQTKLEVIKRKFTRISRRVAETGRKTRKSPDMETGSLLGTSSGPSGRKAKHREGQVRRAEEKHSLPCGQPLLLLQLRAALLSHSILPDTVLWQQIPVCPCWRPSTHPSAGLAPAGLGVCQGSPRTQHSS